MRLAFFAFVVCAALPATAGEMHELVWIGFENQADLARVFVKTNEQVQYRMSEGKDNTLILDLFDTRVQSRNQKRPMDTSEFDSPVLRIAAEEREGAARQVRIEIKLRKMTAYEVKQQNERLAVEIKR
jgi:colicin import membrane protein